MAINIVSSYSNPQLSAMQKFHNVYKKSVDEKAALPKNDVQEVSFNNENITNDIREYLSVDEKRVLKEVFGDLDIDKNNPSPYSVPKYSELLKGSQLDIRI